MPQRNGFARTNIAGVQFVHNRGIAGVSICLKKQLKLPRPGLEQPAEPLVEAPSPEEDRWLKLCRLKRRSPQDASCSQPGLEQSSTA
jgi:hypothetical protein